MYTLTIYSEPSGHTETMEFDSADEAVDFWADLAFALTRKGWWYDSNKSDDMLSRLTQRNKSITVYLSKDA